MSIRLTEANSEKVERTTDLFDINGTYSMGGWMKRIGGPSNGGIMQLGATTSWNNSDVLHFNGTTTWRVFASNAGSETNDTGTDGALAYGTWFHAMLVRESVTSLKFYLNGVLKSTMTQDVTGRTAAGVIKLGDREAIIYSDAELYAWQAYTSALTLGQVQAAMKCVYPIDGVTLYGWWPFLGDSTRKDDFSGNNKNWTEINTPTNGASQPNIIWGNMLSTKSVGINISRGSR